MKCINCCKEAKKDSLYCDGACESFCEQHLGVIKEVEEEQRHDAMLQYFSHGGACQYGESPEWQHYGE